MLTNADMVAWVEIQAGLARAAEREFEAAVIWQHYERRRQAIYRQIGGEE